MLIVPQYLILIKILLKKILIGLINSAQNYHPKIHRLKTYKTHFLNSYLVNHKRSGKTLEVYLSFFFSFFSFFGCHVILYAAKLFPKTRRKSSWVELVYSVLGIYTGSLTHWWDPQCVRAAYV